MSRVNRFQEGHGPPRETWDPPTTKRRKPRVRVRVRQPRRTRRTP